MITSADKTAVIVFNYIGDASFALTGTLAAGEEGMDLLGGVIVGFVTALGGGTFRDVMLGRTPIFWLVAWDEALLCVCVSIITFFLWPRASRRLRLTVDDEWLFWTDTLGLGVFAANGAYAGCSAAHPLHFAGAAACGMFTATFGGGLRFFATDSIALHFDVRNHLFDSDILGESETTQNLEAHIGERITFKAYY